MSVNKKVLEKVGVILFIAVFVFPVLSFAGDEKIYVDYKAKGEDQDGSSKYPYSTISKAISHADDDTEIHIREGVYKENIDIPKGVEIYGSNKDEVIIEADDDDNPVVKMNHKTKINKVTIKGGEYGITVGKNDRASIIECSIEDNEEDGIIIREGETNDDHMVSISESEIKDNGKSGIYSEERRLSIVDNKINNNENDGIDLEDNVEAWIDDNDIKDNDGSGMKFTLDDSEIWTKNNTIRDNEREGIEVNAYGKPGRIDINKSKLYQNDNYGIARVQRGSFSSDGWSGFTVQDDNIFWENVKGGLSHIIKI